MPVRSAGRSQGKIWTTGAQDLATGAMTLEAPKSSPAPSSPALAGTIEGQVFTADPPIHKPVRKALVVKLGPKQVVAMEPGARGTVDGTLGSLPLNVRSAR